MARKILNLKKLEKIKNKNGYSFELFKISYSEIHLYKQEQFYTLYWSRLDNMGWEIKIRNMGQAHS